MTITYQPNAKPLGTGDASAYIDGHRIAEVGDSEQFDGLVLVAWSAGEDTPPAVYVRREQLDEYLEAVARIQALADRVPALAGHTAAALDKLTP